MITRGGATRGDDEMYKLCAQCQSVPEDFASYIEILNPRSDLREKLGLTHADSATILRVMLNKLKADDNKNQSRDIVAALSYIFRLNVSVERRIRDLEMLDGFVGAFEVAQGALNNSAPEVQKDFVAAAMHHTVRDRYNHQVPMMRQAVGAPGDLRSFQSYKAIYIAYARLLIEEGLKQENYSLSDLRGLSNYAKRVGATEENTALWKMYLAHPDIPTFDWVIYSGIMKAWEACHPYTRTLPWLCKKLKDRLS